MLYKTMLISSLYTQLVLIKLSLAGSGYVVQEDLIGNSVCLPLAQCIPAVLHGGAEQWEIDEAQSTFSVTVFNEEDKCDPANIKDGFPMTGALSSSVAYNTAPDTYDAYYMFNITFDVSGIKFWQVGFWYMACALTHDLQNHNEQTSATYLDGQDINALITAHDQGTTFSASVLDVIPITVELLARDMPKLKRCKTDENSKKNSKSTLPPGYYVTSALLFPGVSASALLLSQLREEIPKLAYPFGECIPHAAPGAIQYTFDFDDDNNDVMVHVTTFDDTEQCSTPHQLHPPVSALASEFVNAGHEFAVDHVAYDGYYPLKVTATSTSSRLTPDGGVEWATAFWYVGCKHHLGTTLQDQNNVISKVFLNGKDIHHLIDHYPHPVTSTAKLDFSDGSQITQSVSVTLGDYVGQKQCRFKSSGGRPQKCRKECANNQKSNKCKVCNT